MDLKSESNYFRDCKDPTFEPVEGIVSGAMPPWLEGTLFRNGAGIQTVGSDHFNHFFDGLAVLHRFHIENGKVTYSSRPLESEAYEASVATGRIVGNSFGTLGAPDPCDTLFSKFKSMFIGVEKKVPIYDLPTDNCNVNVGYFGDHLYALTETTYTRRFDPETLRTIGGKTSVDKYIPINQASAHPHILADGNVVTMGINYRHKKGPHYVVMKIPPASNSESPVFENSKIVAEIPARWKLWPSYYHSFSLTGDKVVFVEQPLCFSIPRFFLSKLLWRATFSSCLGWWPNQNTRIHVVSTLDGKRNEIIYETPDLFIFHQVNAYEQDGHMVLDLSAYNSGEIVNAALSYTTMNDNCDFKNSLKRYIFPLEIPKNVSAGENLVKIEKTKSTATLRPGSTNVIDLVPETLYPRWFEFPRINYAYNGKKYRYAYGATPRKNDNTSFPEPNQISKVDLETQEMKVWDGGESVLVSEPVFVLNSDLKLPGEDDGVLLVSQLHLDDERKVSLVILDAKSMELIGKVEFKADGTVPSTLHGQWAGIGELVHKY